jgi:hypothetical protein
MSHNVQISGVKIANMDALRSAIDELRTGGVDISLDQCGTFRTYRGQPNRAEYTIHLPRETYDIGLNRTPEGHYAPVFDHDLIRNGSVACAWEPGERPSADDRVAGAIGKVMQMYSVHLMEREAAMKGYSTRRESAENGAVEVVVDMAA